MKNILKYTVFVVVLLSPFFGTTQTKFEPGSWDDVLEKAQQEGKPVFVDLYFTGCMPCAEMDKRVFPDPKVATILNNDFITYKVNVYKDEEKVLGERLMKKYGITGFPTFLLLAPDQHIIAIESGFIGVDNLVNLLAEAKAKNREKTFKDYSPSFNLQYPDFYNTYFETKKLKATQEEIEAYLDAQPDKMAEIPFLVMLKLVYKGKYAAYYIEHAQELAEKYGEKRVSMSMLSKVPARAKELAKNSDYKAYDKMLADLKTIFSPADWQRLSIETLYQPYYKESKDATWFIGKIKNGGYDWQDKSNAYAQIIIDSGSDRSVLSLLYKEYKKYSPKNTKADIYKEALILSYLGKYNQAAESIKGIDKAKDSYGTSDDDIAQLLAAIQNKNLNNFKPKKAWDPKPFSMD
ncbi:thioredoxin fold domain-containing protein [Zhouia spongiae]|uniref:Thioredoxin fold domain-containing protein n=1 Tax=Zhouia spongiae TaxID=2202721 RepID=A0ABY3YLD9_9FLAO|nr:thioredoxin fold domain-containing protein [Zhouia spongiae]UNY98513.1 thioredoxin fold domain-containing protein [Zhouia spongiae]